MELGCESWTSFASSFSQQQCNGHCPCDSAQARQLKQQLRSALVAAPQWRGDTAVTLTPCIRILKFSAGAPVTARPSRSRQTQNIDPGKLHRFTSNVGIAPLTGHHSSNGEASRVLWCKFHDIWFLVHLTISIFVLDFERLQENATTWCILVVVSLLLNISCVI